jgi:transposase
VDLPNAPGDLILLRWFWAIARDDRPWGGTDPPAVVYSYAPGRGSEHASALLKGFRGILQTDGYVAYKSVAGSTGIGDSTGATARASRWRTVGRIAAGGSSTSPRRRRAREALQRIAALYDIEAEVRGKAPRSARPPGRFARSRWSPR